MNSVYFHPEAESEMNDAAAWHETQQHNLGRRFLTSVQDALNRIQVHPKLYPIVESDVRRCRSIMRNIIPIVFTAVTVLVGCHSPSMVHTQTAAPTVAAPPPFRPMLITTLGTKTSPDGTWRIGVSETSLDLSRSAAYSDGKGLTVSGWTTTGFGTASPWMAHAGWFVFIESKSRVWAYDGDRTLILDAYTSFGTNSSGATYSSRFPCAVPTEVFSRLSEPAQKDIQKHE
jgi:hypothetical protein